MRGTKTTSAIIPNPKIVPGDYAEIIDGGVDPNGDPRIVWFENSQGDIRTRSFNTATDAQHFLFSIIQ